jgi:hypothetical protein
LYNNNTLISTTRNILFILIVAACLSFFVSGISNQTFAQEGFTLEDLDLIERESLLSNETHSNNNTSNESLTIEQQQQRENDSLSQQSFNIYEGLGIKIKYFDPWTVLTSSNDSNCYTKDFCMLTLAQRNGEGKGQIWITQDKENSPKITRECKCNTLEEYVRYVYTNTIFQFFIYK